MADEVKIYKPETEKELPLPVENQTTVSSSGGKSSTEVLKPQEESESLPSQKIAYAVISESIDTQKRRILGQFEFGEMGAIRIGKYKQGESGEILITPNGITAINQTGDTTLTIDGTTGNATFRGTIQANSVVGGSVRVGTGSGSAGVFIDGGNKRIIVNDGTYDRVLIGYQSGGF
jgi:hypothetical protein